MLERLMSKAMWRKIENDKPEDEDAERCKGNVGDRCREGDGRRPVEAIARLLVQNATTLHLRGQFRERVQRVEEESNEQDT
jgi:hypothetical protein